VKSRSFHFAVVVSDYHREYTEPMLESVQEILAAYDLTVIWVPGSFEIPLQVQRLAESNHYDAVIALGLIWQGATLHNTEILRAVTDALMKISLECDVPVIHEVLSIRTEKQARERCKGKMNRGREAALAALSVARLKG
jgi:6,7-dimethyl-8-ribityllumazine synthase